MCRCGTVLALALAFLQVERARSEDSKEFAPKNGMFTIVLPAGQEMRSQTRLLRFGKRRVPIEASMSVNNGTKYTGASIGIPAVAMRNIAADERFDVLGKMLAGTFNGKIAKTKDIKQDGVPGKEFELETKKGEARLQLYTIAGWVVFAVVEGSKEQVHSKEADAFFSSLKLTDSAKKVFSEVKR